MCVSLNECKPYGSGPYDTHLYEHVMSWWWVASNRLKMSEEEYDALRARLEQERMEAEKQSCMLKQKLVQMKSTVQVSQPASPHPAQLIWTS